MNGHLLGAVAVHNFDAISSAPQVLAHVLGNHHRAMLSPSAAESNGEIALSFVDVVRNQIHQQAGDTRDELAGLRKGSNVFRHPGVATRQRAEFGNEMRVGKETNVEDEVSIFRQSLAEAETNA